MLVIPIYKTCSFSEDTVAALYIMQLEGHFRLAGIYTATCLCGCFDVFSFIIFQLCALMV